MSDDLMSFNSPAQVKMKTVKPMEGLKSPLIPCPTLSIENNPFDSVAIVASREDDPFEQVLKVALTSRTPDRPVTEKRKQKSLPVTPTSCKREPPALNKSELDITEAVFRRKLISSTPNSSRCVTSPKKASSGGLKNSSLCREMFRETATEFTSEELRLIVKQKMENLESLNRSLKCNNGPSSLRRSASASSLYTAELDKRSESTFCHNQSFNSSYIPPEETNVSPKRDNSEPFALLGDLPSSDQNRIKQDLYTLSLYFDACANQDDEILCEMPPWGLNCSSSSTESPSEENDPDGFPKIKKFRLSRTFEVDNCLEVSSLISRYHKTRSSLKLEDKDSENVPSESSSKENEPGEAIEPASVPSKVPDASLAATVELPAPVLPIPVPSVTAKMNQAASNVPKKGPLKALVPLPNMLKTGAAVKSKQKGSSLLKTPKAVQVSKPVVPMRVQRSNSNSSLLEGRSSEKGTETNSPRPGSAPNRGALKTIATQPTKIGMKPIRSAIASGKENQMTKKK